MANNNDFSSAVGALFKGMDSFITTKTVVGEPQQVGDTIILPLVDVSFGVGAGAFSQENGKKNNGGGGMGGKITPSAVLVIQNGQTKLVNIRNQETITKVLDMVPDVVDKVSGFFSGKAEEPIKEEDLFQDHTKETKEE
ncbi:MAG: GerW family sporulation protein [Firmicutes bacterium]|uniref:GerW family sporulation protein n=1 Tax=Candidatus Scybalomonas excrementavium TaxID=2840943 RepID=A0A9D9N7Y1_9FIRM|nr:GerW family sporulation protein [Candidatus Scybalomonas excrementavium]